MRITSRRRAGYVVELLEKMFANANLKSSNKQFKFEEIKKKSKFTLIAENLIRLEGTPDAVHSTLAKVWQSHDKSLVNLSDAVTEVSGEPMSSRN